MKHRLTARLASACLMMLMMTSLARAEEPRVVLLENTDGDELRLHYPLLISNKRGYRIRCQSPSDEDAVIRGLGVISLPGTILTARDQAIKDADPLDNPLLCPDAVGYRIKVFTFVGQSGREFYFQFPSAFGSPVFTNKLYRPGCTGLVEALKVKLDGATEADPRPFIGVDNIHDIQCLTGTLPPPAPQSFLDWCTKPDLTDTERVTVEALLNQTPGGPAALGDHTACAAAGAFLAAVPSLNLTATNLTNLSPVSALPNLKGLILADNSIVDTAPLAKLVNLTVLDLSKNRISDISALALMASLTEVDISANKITQLRPLSSNRALTRLRLADNQISDVSPLRFLDALTVLDLSNNRINSQALAPLNQLAALTSLDLSGNALSDVDQIRTLSRMASLKIHGNELTSIRSLLALTELDTLDIGLNPISSLEGIQSLTKLRSLDLSGTSVSKVGFLDSLPQLQIGQVNLAALNIDYGRFEDYCLVYKFDPDELKAARPYMDAIQPLLAADDVDPANCEAAADWARNRQALNLNGSNIVSIDPVRFFTDLRELDLSQNQIEDARSAAGLTSLEQLRLGANRLSTLESVDEIMKYSPSLADNPVCENVPDWPVLEACDLVSAPVMLINVQTGKCLTIAGGVSTENNIPALQFDCDRDPSRRWRVARRLTGVQIRNVQTGKCLAIEGGVSADASPVQFDCGDDPWRRWGFMREGGGAQIISMQTAKCLTIPGGASAGNNVRALQFDCDGDPARIWSIRVPTDG